MIGIIGFGINMPPSESLPDDTNEQISAESTSESDGLDTLEQQKIEAEFLALSQKNEQERFDSELQDLRATLPALAYDEVQTIELNDNTPLFGPLDLTLENGSWETYGELDKLNRATSAEAMLNQDLMPTEKRGDISNVEPTGWKNKKLGKSYLYNRTHLIGFALSGENDNWKNLITATTQLNNPEMLRHEMDIKYYLEQDADNYVRYSVVPIFKDDELLARGVHLMAKSVNDDTIRFNVYIFNIQDGVELNYADGSSLTEEEIAEKDRIAAQNEDQDRIAAEEASVQAEPVEATIQSQETQYVDANGQGTIKGSNSGIYHLPGSTYYHKTTNVAQWFKTISEAENAGYRAPKR
ncbi:MAG: DNA/RNA non-specific endonuclease [Enterococcus aquimarinus]